MVPQLVIFDPETERTCSGNCCRIEVLVRRAFAPQSVRVSSMRELGTGHAAEPDMVVLRAPARHRLIDVLRKLRECWRTAPVVAAVCNIPHDVSELLDSLHNGLDDFFCCPFPEMDFLARLRRCLEQRTVRAEAAPDSSSELKLDMLVGESAAFLQAVRWIPRVANSTATVVIAGETGVGKELFARAIHYNGERKSRPFIPINCSALPDHLFENELFGHVRGAYTDAASAEKGLLAEADGGTVFLDEVDMLAPASQAKLLRFLQDREYRPLGSSKTLQADARVIAASNADLRELVAERRFREDLFHRLNVLSLRVPALRERMSDIPLLAHHFLARFAGQYNRGPLRFSAGALRKMLSYGWPGNVRELEGLLHRAVVFGSGGTVAAEDIELPMAAGCAAGGGSKDHAMGEFERAYLVGVLAENQGNVSRAAKAAGKDRRTFQRMMRRHRLERRTFQSLGSA